MQIEFKETGFFLTIIHRIFDFGSINYTEP